MNTPAPDASSAPLMPAAAPTLAVDIEGGLVRLHADYDPQLVEQIKGLPERRFIAKRAEWVLPARRAALAALAALVVERGERARVSERAHRRLRRQGPGRIESRPDGFELDVDPRPAQLEHVRALPERRYLPERRRWWVPPTRAGALAMLARIKEGELVTDRTTVARLERLSAGHDERPSTRAPEAPDDERQRLSPAPHWRHVTRGPIFHANPHQWVDGIGWCVRVRVDPARERRTP